MGASHPDQPGSPCPSKEDGGEGWELGGGQAVSEGSSSAVCDSTQYGGNRDPRCMRLPALFHPCELPPAPTAVQGNPGTAAY